MKCQCEKERCNRNAILARFSIKRKGRCYHPNQSSLLCSCVTLPTTISAGLTVRSVMIESSFNLPWSTRCYGRVPFSMIVDINSSHLVRFKQIAHCYILSFVIWNTRYLNKQKIIDRSEAFFRRWHHQVGVVATSYRARQKRYLRRQMGFRHVCGMHNTHVPFTLETRKR